VLITLLPLSVTRRWIGASAALVVVGWIWAAFTPLYSEWRPQHVSLYYVHDLDNDTARWATIAVNPLPQRMIEAFGAEPEMRPVAPWVTNAFPSFDATAVAREPLEVNVERDGSRVDVRLRSRDTTDFVYLVLPEAAGIGELTIAGHPVPVVARDHYVQARLYAPGGEPVDFTFTVNTAEDFEGYVVDGSHTLPAIAAPYTAARGRLAVPQHQGDQRLAFQRIQF
jgi:hypothetical protein